MRKNEQFVITINRELGSGGRTVGELLAKKLGVGFYDKMLIRALEKKYNLTAEEIERLKGRKHGWWEDFKRVVGLGQGSLIGMQNYELMSAKMPDLLTTDEMFQAEEEILQSIGEQESCVIAGRCGFHVFRNHPNRLSVLIQAPMDYRIQQLVNKRNISSQEAEKIIKQVDQMRENYVRNYTRTSRYDTHNYDLVINMKGVTEEQAADLIMTYIG